MNQDKIFSPLFTDLYELTMMLAYGENNLAANATFSLYIRGSGCLNRGFFVAAGLEDALYGLEGMRFSQTDMEYLQSLDLFPKEFIRSLSGFRFTGDVWTMPEGTICFADEPLMEVTAPIAEAQLVETFLINILGFQTNIATKALRCMHAAKGRPIADFSLRRTQGLDAGMQVARSAYISGFTGTSNVLAGKKYGIPVSGTMAHSFVLALGNDLEAFRTYSRSFPDNSIFLIDTHDVIEGARSAVKIALEMAEDGHLLKGVRIDSGEMVEVSKKVRHILNEAGLHQVQIIATSGFDEFEIEKTVCFAHHLLRKGYAYTLQVTMVIPYPGTPLFKELEEYNQLLTRDWDDYDMRTHVMQSGVSEERIKTAIRDVYRGFLHPETILRRLISMRNPVEDIKFFWRGFRSILGHLRDFKT